MLDGDQLVSVDLRSGRGTVAATAAASGTAAVSAASPVVADASAHQRVFEDFIRAVSGRTPPACDGVSGRVSVAVIEAIYRSSASGDPVDVAMSYEL